jgi:hypothetical protein
VNRKHRRDARVAEHRRGPAVPHCRGSVDIFNLLNSSGILAVNNTYGAAWQSPTQILQGRLIKLGMQLEF